MTSPARKAYDAAYYLAHKETINARVKVRRAANIEAYRAYQREYHRAYRAAKRDSSK